jgi:hypothetical protein
MKQGEDTIKVVEVILEQRQSLGLGRQWAEDRSLEEIAKDFRFPVSPLVVVDRNVGYSSLERVIASL